MEQKEVAIEVLSLALVELDKCPTEPVIVQSKQAVTNLISRLKGIEPEVKKRTLPPILGLDKKKATTLQNNLINSDITTQKSPEEGAVEGDLTVSQIMFEANVKKYKESYGELTPKQLRSALKKEGIEIEKIAEDLQIDISKYTGEARFEIVIQRLLTL